MEFKKHLMMEVRSFRRLSWRRLWKACLVVSWYALVLAQTSLAVIINNDPVDDASDMPCPDQDQRESDPGGTPSDTACKICTGLPVWRVSEPNINLWIEDEPFAYQPAVGPRVSLRLSFKQRNGISPTDSAIPEDKVFSFGRNWNSSWLSYLVDSVDIEGTHTPAVFFPGGWKRQVTADGSTRDFLSNKRFGFAPASAGSAFTVKHPSGAVDVYGQKFSFDGIDYYFLTERKDPSGQALVFEYEQTQSVVKLRTITDGDGHKVQLHYSGSSLRVESVTDDWQRQVTFVYDPNDSSLLQRITDVGGLESFFTYQDGTVSTMTTPYGVTSFIWGDAGNGGRWMQVNEPENSTHLYYYSPSAAPGLTTSYQPNEVPNTLVPTDGGYGNTFENQELAARNSFHWNARQFSSLPVDNSGIPQFSSFSAAHFYLAARKHWLRTSLTSSNVGHVLSMEVLPSPEVDGAKEGQKIWYDYQGKADTTVEGTESRPLSIAYVLPDGTTHWTRYERDPSGGSVYNPLLQTSRMISTYTDDSGALRTRTFSFEYDSADPDGVDLKSITGPQGLIATLTHENHQIKTLTQKVKDQLAPDHVTDYVTIWNYEDTRQLHYVVLQDGRQVYYKYYPENDSIDPSKPNMDRHRLSRIEVRTPSQIGELTRDAGGEVYDFTYHETGLVQDYTDTRGITRTFTWDNLQRPIRIQFSTGGEEGYSYVVDDHPGGPLKILDCTSRTNRSGHVTGFLYDGLRQLKRQTENVVLPDGSKRVQKTEFSYCSCGALDTITIPRNATESETVKLTFDNAGRLVQRTWAYGTPDARSEHFKPNLLGQLTEVHNNGNSPLAVRKFSYNNQGLLSAVENSSGQEMAVGYDSEDHPKKVTYVGGPSFTLEFDRLNRIKSRITDGAGTETWGYTSKGLDTYTQDIEKNEAGVVVKQRQEKYQYDLETRTITFIDGANHPTTYTYSAGGDLVQIKDGNNQLTSWQYDYRNPVVVHEYQGATPQTESLRLTLDVGGRLATRWQPEHDRTAQYQYDSIGSLRKITYGNSGGPAPKAPVSFDYDWVNRLVMASDPSFGVVNLSYTKYGRLDYEDHELHEGQTSSLPTWPSSKVSYSYDSDRLRIGLSLEQPNSANWTQSYGYKDDNSMRLEKINGGSLGYGYANPTAWYQSLQLPNQTAISRIPDGLGRPKTTALNNKLGSPLNQHEYNYNLASEQKSQTRTGKLFDAWPFENTVTYGYYDDGQLKTAVGTEGAQFGGTARSHEQFTYIYDNAGNLTSRSSGPKSVSGPKTDLEQTFTVLSLNQIQGVNYNGSLTVSGMVGARASRIDVGVNGESQSPGTLYSDGTFASAPLAVSSSYTATVTRGVDTASATVTLNPASPVNFSYDGNGNLTSDGRRTFTYDEENQLIRVEMTGQWSVDYVYDGLGRRRVRKETPAGGTTVETRYIYDGMRVIQERDGGNHPQVTYTWGLDLSGGLEGAGGIGGLLARTDSSGTVYYHTDGGGNVTALVDGHGNLVARYIYDPYGNLIGSAGGKAEANTYRFSTKDYDPRAGLYYYGFRWYDPNLQRWINRDPIGEEGGINLYSYVGNDPVNEFDPFGLQEVPLVPADLAGEPSEFWDGFYQGLAAPFVWGNNFYNTYIDPEPPPGFAIGAVPSIRSGARAVAKVPGTYKVCLKSGEKYVGQAKNIYRRLKQHVYSGKWKWEDIKRIFIEQEKSAAKRSQRELERLLEETAGQHPADVDDVLNKIRPPK
jgi:RHS repeat-associated protein